MRAECPKHHYVFVPPYTTYKPCPRQRRLENVPRVALVAAGALRDANNFWIASTHWVPCLVARRKRP